VRTKETAKDSKKQKAIERATVTETEKEIDLRTETAKD
jgi:hypothetical protein